jgi:hypothetical protein
LQFQRIDAADLVSALWRQREANVAANQQNRSAAWMVRSEIRQASA